MSSLKANDIFFALHSQSPPEALDRWLAAPPAGSLHIIDVDGLLKRLNGSETLARNIARMFLEKAPRYLDELQESLSAGNQPGVRHQAHNLKGAAATLGADRLAALAGELEELDVVNKLDHAGRIIQQLAQEFECLVTAVTERGWLA